MEVFHRPFTQEFCQEDSVSCSLWPKWRAALLHLTFSPMPRYVSSATPSYTLGRLCPGRSDKQEIRIFVQQLYSAGSIKCYPVSNMTRFSYVNLLKSFLALLLFGFLLHPGRFAVLHYQLLASLPKWERCTAHCTDNRLDLYI